MRAAMGLLPLVIAFAVALFLMAASLVYLIREIAISGGALKIMLNAVEAGKD